jgi:hypothetical protein
VTDQTDTVSETRHTQEPWASNPWVWYVDTTAAKAAEGKE